MDGMAPTFARALVAAHGNGALYAAKQALANVKKLKLRENVRDWERVIAVIEAMLKTP